MSLNDDFEDDHATVRIDNSPERIEAELDAQDGLEDLVNILDNLKINNCFFDCEMNIHLGQINFRKNKTCLRSVSRSVHWFLYRACEIDSLKKERKKEIVI